MVVQFSLARTNKVRRLTLLIHHEASRGQHELSAKCKDEKHLNSDARKHVLFWRLEEALYATHEKEAEDEHKYSSIKHFHVGFFWKLRLSVGLYFHGIVQVYCREVLTA